MGSLVSTAGYFFVNYQYGWPQVALAASGSHYVTATTMTLAAVVFCQIANVMNCRTQYASVFALGLFSNYKINVGILAEFLILLILMYVPLLRGIFQTGALNWADWIFLVCIPLPVFLIEELRKAIVRRQKGLK